MRRLLPLIFLISAISLYAADFWKTKKPDQWNDNEVNKMLTKSPWVKEITLPTAATMLPPSGGIEGMGGGGGGSLRGGGGMGGGDMGGGGGRGGDMGAKTSSPTVPPIIVRWEGAAPVREANIRKQFAHSAEVAQWAQEYYVVSISGFQTRISARGSISGRSGRGAGSAPKQSEQKAGTPPAGANPNADLPKLQGAWIKRKDNQVFPVDKVMVIRTAQGPALYLLFSRKNAITADQKEVTVEFSFGAQRHKAKFKLKNMEYQGKLEL